MDYNGDGLDDFLVPYSGTTWWVVLGTASGLATPANTGASSAGSSAGNAKAIDINGDGLEDLVEADQSSVWYSPRVHGGTFGASQTILGPVADPVFLTLPVFPDQGMKRRVRAPDFNGDGHGDFHIGVVVFDPLTGGVLSQTVELVLGGSNTPVFVAGFFPAGFRYLDLNGDTYTDMAYEWGGTWYYILSVGTGLAGPFTGPSSSGQNPALAVALDWDGNGTEDLVVPHSDGYWRVIRSTGSGLNTVENPGLQFANLGAVFVGDTNGDSLDDLIYANASGTFGVMGFPRFSRHRG
ncbi:MAG: VCBS repeat-containing protein [Steroidobacteraceae bacterium]